MENIGTYTDEKGALHLLILAADVDEAEEIAKAKKHTIKVKFKELKGKHGASETDAVGADHRKPSEENQNSEERPAHDSDVTGDSSSVKQDSIVDDSPVDPLSAGSGTAVQETASTSEDTVHASIETANSQELDVSAVAPSETAINKKQKKQKRSELDPAGTLTLAYGIRGDHTITHKEEEWSLDHTVSWKQKNKDKHALDVTEDLPDLQSETELRVMAEFLAIKGLRKGAYVTAKTDWFGTEFKKRPTLDCVSSGHGKIVLLYADNRGYRVIGSRATKTKAMMAVTTGNAPAAYKEEELYEDAVEYVSSYYRLKPNKKKNDLTKQKYMVFLLMVKSGWGRYSRLHSVWHKVDSTVASLHMSDDDDDADHDDDMPNLVYSDGRGNVELTPVNRKATADKSHVKGVASGATNHQQTQQHNAQESQSSPKKTTPPEKKVDGHDIIQKAIKDTSEKITFEGEAWFNATFGFKEHKNASDQGFNETKGKFTYENEILKFNGTNGAQKQWEAGTFETKSLDDLRKLKKSNQNGKAIKPTFVEGNVAMLHDDLEYNGAVFQAASQFNCLEFADKEKTPADGIAGYVHDQTQGPACAMACAPGTIVRNYFEQTTKKQINTLDDAISFLSERAGSTDQLVTVNNGYAESTKEKLKKLNKVLKDASDRDEAKTRIKVGIQRDTEVTCTQDKNKNWLKSASHNVVTQVYVSAIPLGRYMSKTTTAQLWQPLAEMVLEAAYEATLLVALDLQKKAVLTYVGRGVFGNKGEWIAGAIEKALDTLKGSDLEVVINEYKKDAKMQNLITH
jgi:hypothetical protein